jgi:tetratricopeptide (TPR) repeat protein
MNLFTTYLCTGEVNKARELIENNPDIEFFLGKIKIKLIDRNFDEAISILESLPFEEFSNHFNFIPKSLFLGHIYNMKNDNESAKKYFLKAKQHLEKKLTELEEDSRIYSSLGIAYAGLNMPEKAMIANNKALALMNISKDAWKGFFRELDMAKILMMIGKHNEAIYKLKTLLQINGYLSVELLEKDPFWDPLRKFDNFNALLKNPNYQVNLVNN